MTTPNAGTTDTTTVPGSNPDAVAAAAAAAAASGDTAATDAAAAAAAATAAADAAAAAAAAGTETHTEGQAKAGDPPAAPQPPDKYELAIPEGGLFDESDLSKFAQLAKSQGWTNEQAQAALTDHAAALKAQSDQFLSELTAHTELGGERLAVTQQRANAVLDRFLPADSPEGQALRAGFLKTGYGNWTPLVQLLSRIGQAMGEDRPLRGAGDGTRKRSHADVLFGDAASK